MCLAGGPARAHPPASSWPGAPELEAAVQCGAGALSQRSPTPPRHCPSPAFLLEPGSTPSFFPSLSEFLSPTVPVSSPGQGTGKWKPSRGVRLGHNLQNHPCLRPTPCDYFPGKAITGSSLSAGRENTGQTLPHSEAGTQGLGCGVGSSQRGPISVLSSQQDQAGPGL